MFVTDVITYSSLGSDLPSVMASLERQRPDLVISAGSFDDEVVLARALLESGLRPKAVGLAAAAMQEFPQALGTHAEGFLGPSQWEPRLAYVPDFGPGPAEATEGIRAQGAPPDYPAAQAYAACLIAQRCLEEAGADDESLWRAACALDCATFFGRFRIDPATGLQVGHEVVLVQWRRGGSSWSGRPPSRRPGPCTRGAAAGDDQGGPIDGCPSAA